MGASCAKDLVKVRILLDDDRSFHIEASMKDEDRGGDVVVSCIECGCVCLKPV